MERKTMSFAEFEEDFRNIVNETPSYRYGQHFVNKFIRERNDTTSVMFNERNIHRARMLCIQYIERYQWDLNCLIIESKD